MPIKRCTLPNGGSGYKYGDSGKCYKNRKDAITQMKAIKVSQQKGKGEAWDISEFLRRYRQGEIDLNLECCPDV